MRELNTRLFSACLSTDKMAAGRSRFASLNDEEFDDLLNRKDSENTQKATKKAVTVFREYLSAKNRPEDFVSGKTSRRMNWEMYCHDFMWKRGEVMEIITKPAHSTVCEQD